MSNIGVVSVAHLIRAHKENDDVKFFAYANLILENLKKDKVAHQVKIIESSIDGTYLNHGNIVAHDKINIKQKCKWSQDTWDGVEQGSWQTGCGEVFYMANGTPEKNGMNYCCYCGKEIQQEEYKE